MMPFAHIRPLSGSPQQTPPAKTHTRTQIITWPDSKDAVMDSNIHTHAHLHGLPRVHAQVHADTVTGHVLMSNSGLRSGSKGEGSPPLSCPSMGRVGMRQKPTSGTESPLAH